MFSTFYQVPGASSDDVGQKWWEKETDCAEYEPDIDIPLVFQAGSVMVADTVDVYSMPASSSVSMTTNIQNRKSILQLTLILIIS